MSEMRATMLSIQNTGDGWCRTIFGAVPATPQLATMELGADRVSEGSFFGVLAMMVVGEMTFEVLLTMTFSQWT